jgi:hypothetical protein
MPRPDLDMPPQDIVVSHSGTPVMTDWKTRSSGAIGLHDLVVANGASRFDTVAELHAPLSSRQNAEARFMRVGMDSSNNGLRSHRLCGR